MVSASETCAVVLLLQLLLTTTTTTTTMTLPLPLPLLLVLHLVWRQVLTLGLLVLPLLVPRLVLRPQPDVTPRPVLGALERHGPLREKKMR